MQELDDTALLREYVERDSGEAFAAIVTQHIDKVYSVAWRHTRNPHQAEEITQAVFVILANKSRRLSKDVILSGWLYQTARLTAVTFIRSEIRRAHREQEVYMQNLPDETESEVWPQIAPLLDTAIAGLSEIDRHAVVLRFFDGRSMSEVGAALGTSEDAAKKRVNRAVEKLRGFFTKRGVVLPAAVLTAAISANSVQAAPAVLAKTATAVAFAKGATASGSTLTLIKGALKVMAWSKAKFTGITILGILLAAGTTTVVVQHLKGQESNVLDTEKSWRFAGIGSDTVAKLPPEVKILPTKFPDSGNLSQGGGPDSDKFVGIGQPVVNIIWAAYNWPQARTVFAGTKPTERYDFITTLAKGSREALQAELKSKLGLVAQKETRAMDVMLLKVRNANAPGLRPPANGGYCYLNHNGNGFEIKWANEHLSKIADFLQSGSPIPIIDQTGETKRCSIDLKWEESAGDLEHQALQKTMLDQLGLELVPSHESIEMLVVQEAR